MVKIVLAALLFVPAALFSQTGAIRGQVTDARTGDPLIGANVIIVGSKPGHGAASDLNGMFLMHKVPPGEYTVRASYVDYLTVTLQNVKVNAGQTTEVRIAMRKEGEATVAEAADTLVAQKDTTKGAATDSLKQDAGGKKQEKETAGE